MRDQIPALAKRANQRLRELEKRGLSGVSGTYRLVQAAAYSGEEYTRKTAKGQIAFKTEKGRLTRSDEDIKREFEKLNKFLNAKTSTATGLESVWKPAHDKYKNEGGTASFNDYAEWQADTTFWRLVQAFDYYTAIEIYEEYDPATIVQIVGDHPDDLGKMTVEDFRFNADDLEVVDFDDEDDENEG